MYEILLEPEEYHLIRRALDVYKEDLRSRISREKDQTVQRFYGSIVSEICLFQTEQFRFEEEEENA